MKLYIVPTPIGNLEDITLRALRVLKEADGVLAEDTRVTGNLLKHFQISKPLTPYHSFNEHKMLEQLTSRLVNGETLALVSDAGTPGISDPAFLLVRECIRLNIPVECLPGATAFVPALVQSGFPCDEFIFIGFLPQKKGRKTALEELSKEVRTVVLYESPHRLLKVLGELLNLLGDERKACVCREMTKLHEEIVRGTFVELKSHFSSKTIKGEIVLVVEGKTKKKAQHEEEEE